MTPPGSPLATSSIKAAEVTPSDTNIHTGTPGGHYSQRAPPVGHTRSNTSLPALPSVESIIDAMDDLDDDITISNNLLLSDSSSG